MTSLLDRARTISAGAPDDEQLDVPETLGTADDLPELDADPVPDKRSRRRPRASAKSRASKATAAKQTRTAGRFASKAKQIENLTDELDLYAKLVCASWALRDPECAAVGAETSRKICAAAAKLISRSDYLMDKVQTTGVIAEIIELLHAGLPLLRAVYVHHVSGRRATEEEEDRATVSTAYEPWRPTFAEP